VIASTYTGGVEHERLAWLALLLPLVTGACNSIVVHDFDFEPRLSDYKRPKCVVTGNEWVEAERALRDKLSATLGPVPFRTVSVRDPDAALEYSRGIDDVIAFMARDAGYVIVHRGTVTSMFCVEVVHNVGGSLLVPRLFSTMEP
jgi:hypothetical protein